MNVIHTIGTCPQAATPATEYCAIDVAEPVPRRWHDAAAGSARRPRRRELGRSRTKIMSPPRWRSHPPWLPDHHRHHQTVLASRRTTSHGAAFEGLFELNGHTVMLMIHMVWSSIQSQGAEQTVGLRVSCLAVILGRHRTSPALEGLLMLLTHVSMTSRAC